MENDAVGICRIWIAVPNVRGDRSLRRPCFLRVDAADVGTFLVKGTLAAFWSLGMADLASVADEVDV